MSKIKSLALDFRSKTGIEHGGNCNGIRNQTVHHSRAQELEAGVRWFGSDDQSAV